MKRLDIIVPHEYLTKVNEVLHKHAVGGMSFFDIKGRGHSKEHPVSVGRGLSTYVPEFAYRTKIEVVVSDDVSHGIISDLRALFTPGSNASGKIFVYNVIDAFDIASKQRGDKAL